MKNKKSVRILLSIVVVLIIILPVQVALAQSAGEVVTLEADDKKAVNVKDDAVAATKSNTESIEDVPVLADDAKKQEAKLSPESTKQTSMSTGAKVGLGVGAVVIVGGVIALAGGGGGSDGGSSSSTSSNPPTADSLVSAWQANAKQPGSGLTYTGTYQLYQGGALSYALNVSDGQYFAGGGSWTIEGYKLTLRTDHSVYSGSFAAGTTTSVALNSNTGWSLTLSR